ncbi:TraC family protein [Shewanella sp. GD03713]|uniref:TraC family protein n=1 Tax=Shewanella sp. GD03713 TaxID=2975372 RepID=UPI00244AAF92|nr:TraC family protein [Shewanella sp. GD03713]MDH1472428.1 TraC family protein [Shewanella sp. GD03713]
MAGIIDRHNSLIGHNQYGDVLPVLEFIPEMGGYILDGGYIGFTFICQPLTGVNTDLMNALDDLYQRQFPADSFMQVSLFGSPYIKWILDRFGNIREGRAEGEMGELYDEIGRSTHKYYSKSVDEPLHPSTGLKVRDYEVWVSFKMPLKKQEPSKDELKMFRRMYLQLKSTLESIGAWPEDMTAELYVHRMQILHNQSKNADWREGVCGHDAGVPLRYQVMERGNRAIVHQDGIEFGDTERGEGSFVKLLSVQRFPEILTFGDMYDLVCDWRRGREGLREPFLMTLNIHFPNQEKASAEFVKNRSWLTHQASGPLAKWVDRLRFQKKDYDEFYMSLENKGAQIANCYLQMIVFSENRATAERAVMDVQSFASKRKWKFVEDRYICLPLYLSSLPMGLDEASVKNFHRFNRMASDALKFVTPMIASWKGNGLGRPTVPLVTRDGQFFCFDPFTSDGNYNMFTAAASGSGKSFWINYLVSNVLTSGNIGGGNLFRDTELPEDHKPLDRGRVFIIDVGRSYEKLCELYNGRFLEFGENFKYSLNPFKSIHEFAGKDGQGDMVLSLLKFMASPSGTLTDFQTARMNVLLNQLWDMKGQNSTIDDFAEICKKDHDDRVKDIGFQLEPWCKDGPYGEFFNDENPPVDFSGDFVVIELEELKSRKQLQIAVLLQCISCIQHEMFLSGKDRNKLFILDEAWEYIKIKGGAGLAVAEFLEAGWRRFRKYQAAGICITQSIADAYETEVGRAMADNSQFKVFLRQEPEVIEKVRANKQFDGNETDFALLKSIHTVKGQYSELYIRTGSSREVCRLFVPRYQQLMFTTDGKELSAIDRFRKEGMTIAQAIQAVIAEEESIGRRTSQADDEVFTAEELEEMLAA